MADNGTITFSDQWEFYPTQIGDKPFSVRFDAQVPHLDEAERARYPHILVLQLPFADAREDGFPTRAEMDRLNAAEDHFAAQDSVRLIGVLTGDGASRFVFCCRDVAGDFEAVAGAVTGDCGVDFLYNVFEGDHFGYFDKVLAPSVYEHHWIANRHLIENLEQQGDKLEAPRTVDFHLCFCDGAALEAALDKLLALGYAQVSRGEAEDGMLTLHLVREEVPTFERMNQLTGDILDALDQKTGSFDGWGCTVEK